MGNGDGPSCGRGERDEWQQDGLSDRTQERFANALGWLSLGLGVPQVAAPADVAKMIGVRDDEETRAILRTVGLREIASGAFSALVRICQKNHRIRSTVNGFP